MAALHLSRSSILQGEAWLSKPAGYTSFQEKAWKLLILHLAVKLSKANHNTG